MRHDVANRQAIFKIHLQKISSTEPIRKAHINRYLYMGQRHLKIASTHTTLLHSSQKLKESSFQHLSIRTFIDKDNNHPLLLAHHPTSQETSNTSQQLSKHSYHISQFTSLHRVTEQTLFRYTLFRNTDSPPSPTSNSTPPPPILQNIHRTSPLQLSQ